MSRLCQIIGRAIRFCSHKDLPLSERNVDVFIYLGTHPEIKESIDQYIMKIAIEKQNIVEKFEKALKEVAIDCKLNYNANKFRNEKLICYEE